MSKIKCITFDKEAQEALPQDIKNKMKADKEKARAGEKGIHIHRYGKLGQNRIYYFTKDAKHCLCIEYNPDYDFGKGSPSGARVESVEIHTNNGFLFKDDTKEISLDEVPECILDLLTFLK